MCTSWTQRLSRISEVLGTSVVTDDEERQGKVLDEYLLSTHAQGHSGEVGKLRFKDDDLTFIGKLAVGQFGTVDVVRCRLDSRVYARKTIDKRSALRARGQCSPQIEREILVRALKSDTVWVPHILCAFQTETALKIVMQYADGGNLWDVIESSLEGRISPSDLRWWAPQMVSAIEWCHSQGFVHRDIKPHNFVLTPTSHLLLIDFGSAAPLLPPSSEGIQLVPKEHCLVPCGTCDYISPEILQCHEEALVALELDEGNSIRHGPEDSVGGYGRETDWWSFGAMLYEMAFGMAPFFANDVAHTYIKIVEHRTNLKFNAATDVSNACISLFRGVLCDKENRLGRRSVKEIKTHPFFEDVDWSKLSHLKPPPDLHLPRFTYSVVPGSLDARIQEDQEADDGGTERFTQPSLFSALFQSSKSTLAPSVTPEPRERRIAAETHVLDAFIGFSWGPHLSAFDPPEVFPDISSRPKLHREPVQLTPRPMLPSWSTDPLSVPQSAPAAQQFFTPIRDNAPALAHGHTVSIPRTGTSHRIQCRRLVTDREAMRQLVDCVGMSARKKVLESGKKPTHLPTEFTRVTSKRDFQRFISIPKPLAIKTSYSGESSTSSEGNSQPPSPTPRPGSALSRRSGWGGRSTPSLLPGRSTPTWTFTAAGTVRSTTATGIENAGRLTHSTSTWTSSESYDQMILDVEKRHTRLLSELALLEESMRAMSLRLRVNE